MTGKLGSAHYRVHGGQREPVCVLKRDRNTFGAPRVDRTGVTKDWSSFFSVGLGHKPLHYLAQRREQKDVKIDNLGAFRCSPPEAVPVRAGEGSTVTGTKIPTLTVGVFDLTGTGPEGEFIGRLAFSSDVDCSAS